MPVPGFLASFADKAQSAINSSPLAAHLPNAGRTSSPDQSAQPTANDSAAQGGHRSHALDAIQYQLRAFGQQYSNTTAVQKIITTQKGVAIDFDSVSRDSKAQSKELYTWGQTEADDLKDVTDRLAYLNFVQGSLASSLAIKLDAARAPLKALRDAETSLAPRRNIRASLQNQIARLEHDQQKGMEKKVAEIKDQLRKAELDDQGQEREVDALKRKGLRESEQQKWEAIREYGEKLVLLSQAATPIISALPSVPPTPNQPYTGAQATGAARASLQRALDNYKTGHINLPPQLAGSDLSRSDTRSFGESHASELSSINSDLSGTTRPAVMSTPQGNTTKPLSPTTASHPPSSFPTHDSSSSVSPLDKSHSPPINPNTLNLSPAHIPLAPSSSSPVPIVTPDPTKPTNIVPVITPTVAETGVPVSAGADGPGPASGSLHDIKGASALSGPRSGGLPASEAHISPFGQSPVNSGAFGAGAAPSYESAEEEKRRLQAAYSHTGATSSQIAPPVTKPGNALPTTHHESAEEEKKRLEREERERILRDGSSHLDDNHAGGPPRKEDDLPPYQDL
ncbi:Eisosome component PIL1-domain-containing protein [Crucibulum laeve]|uniref:Eisosome component PIL1-domain-containing protein n=1 Tax=Crucibulum laeve TaxID=68775 RepID=A0A5C3M9G6_9AGAR|nr:Eisosome component PIL1-domain-containing protein [Crucibulum laeve]